MSRVSWSLACVDCGQRYAGLELRYRCACGGTLDVVHDQGAARAVKPETFDRRLASRLAVDRSGVWRYRELVLPVRTDEIVTRPEGNTNLYASPALAAYTGVEALQLKHEGENPTGSFKDRGMTVGVTVARRLGMERVACASTGNTSASMAAYAAVAGMTAFVFVPAGKVASGKLAQALAYGAKTIEIEADFDRAMALVEEVARREDLYLLNSVNPFRIEGQKAIAFELLHDLGWKAPDWIVVPGGNLGNSSAIFKGLQELKALGFVPRLPRLAVIQAEGANPLYRAFKSGTPLRPVVAPETLATAIRIGNPVSWKKCLRGIEATQGVVEQVSDAQILEAKAKLDAAGIGAEPASGAALAGVKKLVAAGIIGRREHVCVILTGHLLKDPETVVRYHGGELQLEGLEARDVNRPVRCAPQLETLLQLVRRLARP